MPVIWGIVIAVSLEEAAVAALGLAILAAAVPLGILAGHAARQLPWPLAGIASAVIVATEAAIRVSVSWTEASANALSSVVQAPFQAIWTDIRVLTVAAEHLYWASDRIRNVTVPAVYAWTWSNLVQLSVALTSHANALAAQNAAYAAQLAAAAMQRADAEFVQAVRHADALARAEAAYAGQLADAAMQRADLEFGQAVEHADAVGAAAAAYAGQLAGQVLQFTQVAVLGAERYAERIGVQAEDYARTLERVAVDHADAAVGAAAGAAAVATAAVASRVLAIEQSPCQRFCSPLGDLGSLLQGLEDAGLLALMLELVSEARSHPAAVAGMIGGAVTPLVRDTAHALQLGIP